MRAEDPWVLVVDDDRSMRETAEIILRKRFNVVLASTAEEGLRRMENQAFSVCLCDIRLPGINGIEMLEEAKRRWPSTSFIMCSVIEEVSVAVEAMRRGAFFYTSKSFDWEPLVELIIEADLGYQDTTLQELKRENLKLKRELLRLRLGSVPARISDRRPARTSQQPSCLGVVVAPIGPPTV